MPIDIFEAEGINPKEPIDIFEAEGISVPKKENKKSKSIIDKAGDFAQKYINEPIESIGLPNVAGGFLQGTANIGPGLYNLGAKAANLLPGVDIEEKKGFHFAPEGPASTIGEIGSFFLPFGLASNIGKIPGISNTLQKSSELMSKAPNAIQNIGNIAKPTAFNALLGAAISPEDQGTGAALGAIGGALGTAIPKAFNALKPSTIAGKYLGQGMTNEELKNALELTKGTETSLGNVLNSPFLKNQYENVLSKVPFSGVSQSMQRTAEHIQNKAQDFISGLLGHHEASHVKQTLQDSLKEAAKEAQSLKRKNYTKLNKMADESGLTVSRENFSNEAKNILDEIKESPELLRKTDKSVIDDLEHYASPGEYKLKHSNIFRGKLGDEASHFYQNGATHEYGIYQRLKDALDTDIQESIHLKGTKELKDQYTKSQKFYKEHIAPFEEPEIVKFTRKGGDSDLILSTFIKSGTNDRAKLLSKLMDKIPKDKQNLVAYEFLSKAAKSGELEIGQLRKLFKGLGPNQKKVLFSDKAKLKELEDVINLYDKNKEAFSLLNNPPTGQRVTDYLPVATGLAGYSMGGPVGALAGAVGVPYAANALRKALTSEKIRNKTVNAILKGRERNNKLTEGL